MNNYLLKIRHKLEALLCSMGYHSWYEIWSGWPAVSMKYKTGKVCIRHRCLATQIVTDDLFDDGKPDVLNETDGYVTFADGFVSQKTRKARRSLKKLEYLRSIDPSFWDKWFLNNRSGARFRSS